VPRLEEAGVKLVAVGIGTPERAVEFSRHVGFEPERLFTDPENALYEALDFKKDLRSLAFNEATPFSLLDRVQTGKYQDLTRALQAWKPWIPPKLEQGLQQGGVVVFDGEETLYERKDPSTGAHAPLDIVLNIATDRRRPTD